MSRYNEKSANLLESKWNILVAILYGICIVTFTAYVLLDTFVLERVYEVVPETADGIITDNVSGNKSSQEDDISKENSSINENVSSKDDLSPGDHDISEGDSKEQEVVQTDTEYSDRNIKIVLTEYRENNTNIYVADITLKSIEYLKTAFADGSYGRNVTEPTSDIAAVQEAVLAINGDFYGAKESGYVLRNGLLYRSTAVRGQEDLAIYRDGTFFIFQETDITAKDLLNSGVLQIFCFGPGLLESGNITVSKNEEVGRAMAANPRTVIGIIDTLHYVFVVADGRTEESYGLSLYEMASFLKGISVLTAYNLDGGGSSTMYFNGKVINQPTTNGKSILERSVSDIVYIGY